MPCGHATVQALLREPHEKGIQHRILTPKNKPAAFRNCPLCAACQLSKQSRRAPPRQPAPPPHLNIWRGDLQPGDCVSIDQYKLSIPGRLPNTKGKETKKSKFNGGTIFVDHASSLIFVYNQVSLNVGETLAGKQAFEQFAISCGVWVKSY